MSYREPEWAVAPPASSSNWTLIEIKGGVEVAKHDLSQRPTTILGRAADQVHIPLLHESISRQHARIAFDAQGNPWLRDLQSSHGTFVNKRRLPAAAVGKVESNSRQTGSRGVLLSVGNILKFGASSRMYLLEGPPPGPSQKEEQLANLNRLQQQQNQQSTSIDPTEPRKNGTARANPSQDEGISWGIDLGGDDGGGDGDSDGKLVGRDSLTSSRDSTQQQLLDPSKIPEKYRKELDKLNALKYKLANLETEDSRIRRKGGDLTEGQQKQLDRNADREAILRKSIREKEEVLLDKLNAKSDGGSSKRKRGTNNVYEDSLEDGEDDYFDRTKNDSSINDRTDLGAEEAESEETLTLKWKKLFDEQQQMTTTRLKKANDRVDALKKELKLMLASGNEEAFFVKNDLQLAVESKKKVESSLAKNNSTMDEIERLLKVVNPKIKCDRTLGYIGEGTPHEQPPTHSSSLKSQHHERFSEPLPMPSATGNTNVAPVPPDTYGKEKIVDTSMPPPAFIRKEPEKILPASQATNSAANKRKRVFGPSSRPASVSSETIPRANEPLPKAKRMGTLSFLDHSVKSKADDKNKSMESQNGEDKKERSQNPYRQVSVDTSKMDVWRAPEGQDGSGKTKLNEKFAGRY